MPIPTDVTTVSSFEVIDPVDVAPPSTNFEAYVESGTTQLTQGDQVHDVIFNVEKAALSYVFDELTIFNEVDATPIVLGYIETSKTTNGFEITTSATPDTGNYYVRWKVRIPTTVVEGAVVATPSTGAVTEVTASGSDGIFATVSNPTTSPTINLSLLDGEIALSKLETQPVTGEVLTPTNAKTVTNKLIDGNNNTLQNISLGSLTGDGIIAQSVTDPGHDALFRWNNTNNNVDLITPQQAFTAAANEVKVMTAQGVTNVYKASANTDLARGIALTAAFAAHSNGDTIAVGIGAFEAAAGLGLKHANLIGQGINNTTIRLADQGGAASDTAMVSNFASDSDQSVRHIKGILFDCNLQNQTSSITVSAVSTHNALVVEECGALNWGTKSASENFIFIGGSSSGEGGLPGSKFLRNHIFAPAQITGLGVTTVFDMFNDNAGSTVTADWVIGAEMAGNVVHDITTGNGVGQPSALHVFSYGNNYGTSIHDNYVWNMLGGGVDPFKDNTVIYSDSFSSRSILIYGNIFTNVCQPIYVNCTDVTRTYDNWLISGNRFDVNATGNGFGIIQGGTSTFNNWVISNNFIKASNAISIGTAMDKVTIENNVLDSATPIDTHSATHVTQHNNHKPDGTVVGTPTPWTVAEGGTGRTTGIVNLYDSAGTPKLSIDTNARKLYDTNGTSLSIDWTARTLTNFSALSGFTVFGGALLVKADSSFYLEGTNGNNNLIFAQGTPTADRTISFDDAAGTIGLRVATPASAGAAGVAGTWSYDATHIYVCINTNTWVRSTLATW